MKNKSSESVPCCVPCFAGKEKKSDCKNNFYKVSSTS